MQPRELYIKYKYIIWPIAVGISSVAILALVIIPQLLAYLNTKNQINEIQNRSNFLEAKASELERIDEAASQKDLQVAFTVLPVDQDVLKAIVILQNLVASSGLQLQSTTFASTQQKSDKNSFQLNLTVAGSIQSLRDFLIKLQDSPRVFQVESVTAQFQRSKSVVEAEVPISVFYQAAPASIGPIDQKIPELSEAEKQLLVRLSQIVSQTVSLSSSESNEAVPLGKPDPFE